ncbi:MAG TPA: sigma-70 family RNA polymerase sigma factor [Nitrospiria bacterium]
MGSEADNSSFFEEQVLKHLNRLYAVASRLTKNPADAEDLVAESVTKAWAGRETLKDRNRFRPWVFRILTNTFISTCRKPVMQSLSDTHEEGTNEEGVSFSLFEELHQPFLLWWSSPEKEFLNNLLREDIDRAVGALPEAFRIVVLLSDLQGFSYQEMAKMLKVPVGTIRSRLARGRGLLQKNLWEHAKEAGLTKPKKSGERSHEKSKTDRL